MASFNTVEVRVADMSTDASGSLGRWSLDQLSPLVSKLQEYSVIGGGDPERDAAGDFVIDNQTDEVYFSITTGSGD